jgi:hypothetical protein
MSRRTLTWLTWLTVAAAIAGALWLAWRGASPSRYGVAPLVLGRPVPPADAVRADDERPHRALPGTSRHSGLPRQ